MTVLCSKPDEDVYSLPFPGSDLGTPRLSMRRLSKETAEVDAGFSAPFEEL